MRSHDRRRIARAALHGGADRVEIGSLRRLARSRSEAQQRRRAIRHGQRLARKRADVIDRLVGVTAAQDRMLAEQPIRAREDELRRDVVRAVEIERPALAHLDAEALAQERGGRAGRRVIRDQQQRAAAAHPVRDRRALLRRERGRRGPSRIHDAGVRDHEHVGRGQRRCREELGCGAHRIAVVAQ
jgi:hypothetical protein